MGMEDQSGMTANPPAAPTAARDEIQRSGAGVLRSRARSPQATVRTGAGATADVLDPTQLGFAAATRTREGKAMFWREVAGQNGKISRGSERGPPRRRGKADGNRSWGCDGALAEEGGRGARSLAYRRAASPLHGCLPEHHLPAAEAERPLGARRPGYRSGISRSRFAALMPSGLVVIVPIRVRSDDAELVVNAKAAGSWRPADETCAACALSPLHRRRCSRQRFRRAEQRCSLRRPAATSPPHRSRAGRFGQCRRRTWSGRMRSSTPGV